MNKSELIKSLANEASVSILAASSMLNALETAIIKGLHADSKVQITGFLTLNAKKVPASTGRNPKTGAPIKIPANTRVTARVGKKLKDALKK